MAVCRRKTSSGLTEEYHFRFMQGGKLYLGVCEGCTKIEDAQEFEKAKRITAKNLTAQKSVKALVENFKEELAGGEKIELKNAYEQALKKPRRFKSSDTQKAVKRSYWRDFILYIGKHYPELIFVSDIQKRHAEEYIHFIRENGRFDKTVVFSNTMKKDKGESTYLRKEKKLSARSLNMFHETMSEVFALLGKDAGLQDNPFDDIPKVEDDSESREAFSESELKLIRDNWDEFIRRIFMTGFFTALREGDICTLKIKEVLFDIRIIRRKLLKTGKIVEIPIMAPLESFLREQIAIAGDSEYVFPDLAKMYLENPSGISYRVKTFLEGLGIKTTKKVEGRDREVSIKDVHSLRHTFCYFAGVAGIPLVIVQSIVGHMTPEMTSHYMAHADRAAKHEKMLLLPDLMKEIEVQSSRKINLEKKRKLLLDYIATAGEKEIKHLEKLILKP
ncbi:MAG: tyrosine-type recombinase/integrase [Lentisphaerota bacterium]